MHRGSAVWTIKANDDVTQASFVPELGGIGSSFIFPGPKGPRELLYQHPFFWDRKNTQTRGGAPFLFPICGRIEQDGGSCYQWGKRIYEMPIHGFAMNSAWSIVDASQPDSIVLQLHEDDRTRRQFPFSFEVTLKHRVEPGTLITEVSCTNHSNDPMPYYAGFHPYFLTPEPHAGKEYVKVNLQSESQLKYNESMTAVIGEKEPAEFPLEITNERVNEMLNRLGEDKTATLQFPIGFNIHMEVKGKKDPDFYKYLQMYTMADRGFFCMEPWMQPPGTLNKKDEVHLLQPGDTEQAECRIWTTID